MASGSAWNDESRTSTVSCASSPSETGGTVSATGSGADATSQRPAWRQNVSNVWFDDGIRIRQRHDASPANTIVRP